MTHPDPYIEEKNMASDTWEQRLNEEFFSGIPTEDMGSNQVDEAKLASFIRNLLKTQRIKDIEEIEAMFPDEIESRGKENLYGEGVFDGAKAMLYKIRTILTSRKAAIEEV